MVPWVEVMIPPRSHLEIFHPDLLPLQQPLELQVGLVLVQNDHLVKPTWLRDED